MNDCKKLLLAICLSIVSSVSLWAVGTKAGTEIKNQASVVYEINGETQTATSNVVVTTVLPRYRFEITPDGGTAVGSAPSAGPGQTQLSTIGTTVYFPYKLINESNIETVFEILEPDVVTNPIVAGFDSSDITIYHDVNGNGVIDPGEPQLSGGSSPVVGKTEAVAADGSFNFIIEYTIPILDDNIAPVLDGTRFLVNPIARPVPDNSISETVPDNYSLTTVVNDAVITINIASDVAEANIGDNVLYTISGSNTGNLPALGVAVNIDGGSQIGVLIANELPAGITLDTGFSPVVGPSLAQAVYSIDGSNWHTNPNDPVFGGSSPSHIGMFIPVSLIVSQSYEIQYQTTVTANSQPVDQIIADFAEVIYEDNALTPQTQTVQSNTVDVLIPAAIAADVAVGYKDDPNSDGDINSPIILSDPSLANFTTANGNFIDSAGAGDTILFTNSVLNNGNASDTINLFASLTPPNVDLDGDGSADYNAWPAGTVVQFLNSDGSTPLADDNSDGIPDLTLAAGQQINVVVRVLLPGNANSADRLVVSVSGVSTVDDAVSDLTRNLLGSINAANVSLQNGIASPPNSANPGEQVLFPLVITNTGNNNDTFNLSSSISNQLPPETTVTFFLDIDGDGQPDGAPISSIENLPPGQSQSLIAIVDFPEGASPTTGESITFTATSSLNPAVASDVVNSLDIAQVRGVTLAPNQNGTAVSGGVVLYDHLLTNAGNGAETFNLSFQSSQGWSYVFYDPDTNTVISSVALAASEAKSIRVRGIVPSGTAPGITDVAVITATATDGAISASVEDVTITIASVLQLIKSVDKTSAQPGEDLTYTLDYSNLSTVGLSKVIIIDPIPTNTTFADADFSDGSPDDQVAGPDGSTLDIEYSSDGANFTTIAALGGSANVKFIRWVFNASNDSNPPGIDIPSGFSSSSNGLTLSFKVTID